MRTRLLKIARKEKEETKCSNTHGLRLLYFKSAVKGKASKLLTIITVTDGNFLEQWKFAKTIQQANDTLSSHPVKLSRIERWLKYWKQTHIESMNMNQKEWLFDLSLNGLIPTNGLNDAQFCFHRYWEHYKDTWSETSSFPETRSAQDDKRKIPVWLSEFMARPLFVYRSDISQFLPRCIDDNLVICSVVEQHQSPTQRLIDHICTWDGKIKPADACIVALCIYTCKNLQRGEKQ